MPTSSKKSPKLQQWLKENPIYLWRKRNFYSMEKLGKHIEVSRQLIYCWEKGKALPRIDNAARLYEYTNVNIKQLEEWKKRKPDEETAEDESFSD